MAPDSPSELRSSPDSVINTTLVLVDDRPENLIAMEAVLAGESYRIVSLDSGKALLDYLERSNEVDIILLDVQMPEMDGYETARRVKKMERCRNIPIIFVTAIFNEDPHVRKGYEAGAVDYFTKPFDPEILRMKISIYASFRQKDVLLKERERRIRQSEELLKAGRKLSAVLETLPIGVIISDSRGRIIQTNDSVLRIWGSPKPHENDAYGDFLQWWDSNGKTVKEALARSVATGSPTHNDILHITGIDRAPKTVLSSVSPLRGVDNQIVGAAAVVQDITEHREIERDLEQRILKLITLGVELEQTAHN
jgi:CheY-like chemotaxis protein